MNKPNFLEPRDVDKRHEVYSGPYLINLDHLVKIFSGYQNAGLRDKFEEIRGPDMQNYFGMIDPIELNILVGILRAVQPETIFSIDHGLGVELPFIAEAAPYAKIHTLSIDPGMIDSAKFPYDGRNRRYHPSSTKQKTDIIKEKRIGNRVNQIWDDPGKFDYSEFLKKNGTMDVVIVDDNHIYEAAKHDLNKALEIISEGGIVFVDDYKTGQPGLVRAVSEIVEKNHRTFYHVGIGEKLTHLIFHPNIEKARKKKL